MLRPFLFSTLLWLTACSGGGSSDNPPAAAAPAAPPAPEETPAPQPVPDVPESLAIPGLAFSFPPLAQTEGHNAAVLDAVFSPDGRYILSVSSSRENAVKLWDARSGREIRTFDGAASMAVAISPDGRYAVGGTQLLGGTGYAPRLWDMETGTVLLTLKEETPSPVSQLAFSPDGRYVLAANAMYGNVNLWEAATGALLRHWSLPTSANAVAFTPDGRYALAARNDTIHVWDIAGGAEVRTLPIPYLDPAQPYAINSSRLAVSTDGRFLLTGYGAALSVLEMESGETRRVIREAGAITAVALSPDDVYALSVTVFLEGDNRRRRVTLWQVARGEKIRELGGHADVYSVAFSLDSTRLLTAGDDFTVRVWNTADGTPDLTLGNPPHFTNHIALSPDGRYLISGAEHVYAGAVVKLWDALDGREIRQFSLPDLSVVTAVGFSPDGRYVLAGYVDRLDPILGPRCMTACGVSVWDTANPGSAAEVLFQHPGTVKTAAFSPDGRYVLAGGDQLILWDIPNRMKVREFMPDEAYKKINAVAFSPDGRLAAVGRGEYSNSRGSGGGCYHCRLEVWDVRSGTRLRTLLGGTPPADNPFVTAAPSEWPVVSVAFSADGAGILAGLSIPYTNSEVKLLNAATGETLRTFSGHTRAVNAVAFSPDGQYIASGSDDATVKIWDPASGTALRTFDAHTHVTSLAFSPHGQYLYSGGRLDRTVKVWDMGDI